MLIILYYVFAGFDIFFSSNISQNFYGSLAVQVNGVKAFTISIKAEVLPIELKLSNDEISLNFDEGNYERSTAQCLIIRNDNDVDAHFKFEGDSKIEQSCLCLYSGGDEKVEDGYGVNYRRMIEFTENFGIDDVEIKFKSDNLIGYGIKRGISEFPKRLEQKKKIIYSEYFTSKWLLFHHTV
jgi:hypothetical protein